MSVRAEPCSACPYRRDVPSGVWDRSEYAKLLRYDAETYAQPHQAFACHATPEHVCCGWAVASGTDSLALRLLAARGEDVTLPSPSTALFASHREAAAHGMAEVDCPSLDAVVVGRRLERKCERLAKGAGA